MARRTGVARIPLPQVDRVLRAERADQWDEYATLSDMRLQVLEPLAPIWDRYSLEIRTGRHTRRCRMSQTALAQVCSLAGAPISFVEKVPPSLALKLIRCLMEMADSGDGRRHLLRFKDRKSPKLRAVLPQSYVCLNDEQIMQELRAVTQSTPVHVERFNVADDVFYMRLLLDEDLNLGTQTDRDPAIGGVDLITSETGCHSLELRFTVFRLVCSNGLTVPADGEVGLRARYTQMDRDAFEVCLRRVLDEAFHRSRDLANRLSSTRGEMIENPKSELESIFRRYRLGNAQGKLGRWVASEVIRNLSLFGVSRFDIVQAFTGVARGLDHRDRMRFEDAMGAYLLDDRRLN